ncbi:MAG: hypothetical protein AAF570_07980, partial [Bacteroidota bacterium]
MEIQESGRFFEVDTNGYLINPSHYNLIPEHWRPLVEEVVQIYKSHYPTNLIGIYLRGSVPSGTSVDHVSDLDSFALTHPDTSSDPQPVFHRWHRPKWAAATNQTLSTRFPFAASVEFYRADHIPNEADRNPYIRQLLALQCLCVHGHDVIPDLPRIRFGPNLRREYRWLAETHAEFQQHKNRWPSPEFRQDWL